MKPIASSPVTRATNARGLARPRRVLLPLMAAAVMALSLLTVAAPAQGATIYRTATERSYAIAVLHVLNAQRRVNHRAPLIYNARLRLAARRHNLAMARTNTMSHQTRGELSFAARIDQAGYHWTYAGENVAWNSSITRQGVIALQKIMYRERAPYDGHRQNILSRHFRNVGVDVYIDRAHHKVWLTTDFGHL